MLTSLNLPLLGQECALCALRQGDHMVDYDGETGPAASAPAETLADRVARLPERGVSPVPCAQEPLLGACYRQRNDSVYQYRAPSQAWRACAAAYARREGHTYAWLPVE